MIMADKIIELRKKNGWSQEELAEQLGVSRQSVSKWEGAQSVPDLNKVIAMASLFGVSTDYLLKDELGEEEFLPADRTESRASYGNESVRQVSMEESNAFLSLTQNAAAQISLGVFLCILSPVVLVLTSTAGSSGLIPLTESQGAILGVVVLLIMVAGAVALFVKNGMQLSRYDYLEEEIIETEYGVSGMVKERKQAYESTHMTGMITGIILCVLSAVPILLCAVLDEKNEMLMGVGVAAAIAFVAVGVWQIVRVSIIWGGFQKLLEEGDYTRRTKKSKVGTLMGIYWTIITAIYLGYSFYTMDWARSWIIWPVAGVLSFVIAEIVKILQGR